MTMFPDCRNDDFYNEDFLPEADKQVVFGFDLATERMKDCFNDIDAGDLCGALGDLEVVASVMVFIKESLKDALMQWLESERNMLITSLLDGIEQEEYDKLRAQALKAYPDKEYYDTRKFMCTGKKEFRDE